MGQFIGQDQLEVRLSGCLVLCDLLEESAPNVSFSSEAVLHVDAAIETVVMLPEDHVRPVMVEREALVPAGTPETPAR